MNIKRIIFWVAFIVVLGLIIWGLIAAMNKPAGPRVGTPEPLSAADHVRGPENATITIIEYSDFQCPACQAYHPVVEQLLASSTVPIRFSYRHFPLPQHKNARLAAQASEAASLQGKFWEMHNILFTNHVEWTEQTDSKPVFIGFAQRIGLDVAKFQTDLESAPVKAFVDKQVAEGQSLGIYQTPTFFLNGKMIENPQGYDKFKEVIEAATR